MKNNRQANDEGAIASRSSLYKEFLAERDEIMKHKWIESEKAGYDIGFERALLDWIRNHRDEWKNKRIKELARSEQKLKVTLKTTLSHDARYDAVGWGCTFSSQHGQAESFCSGMTCSEKQAFPQFGLQYIPI